MIDELVIHGWSSMCHNGFSISFCLSFLSMLLNVKTSSGASSCTESHDSPETHILPAPGWSFWTGNLRSFHCRQAPKTDLDLFGWEWSDKLLRKLNIILKSRNCMHNIAKYVYTTHKIQYIVKQLLKSVLFYDFNFPPTWLYLPGFCIIAFQNCLSFNRSYHPTRLKKAWTPFLEDQRPVW